MFDDNNKKAVQHAIDWAMLHNVMLKASNFTSRHAPFSFTPLLIEKDRYQQLIDASPLFGKLINLISDDHKLIREAILPVAESDDFFSALLEMHEQIHFQGKSARRTPLLIMRTDFMDDINNGPQLIEFNGIAAGMGPFGQRIHQLHHELQQQCSSVYQQWTDAPQSELVDNIAIERLADGIQKATLAIKHGFNESQPPRFLMVTQENEDNIFDQFLLEEALQQRGIETHRRTFKELYHKLSTGKQDRLLLEGVGSIDTVYLRAGYQYSDYFSEDIEEQKCCETLMKTRVFIEQHQVAVNATVGQQLATSKRIQLLLSSMKMEQLVTIGLTEEEAIKIQPLIGEMRQIDQNSVEFIKQQSADDWVLKNQGEGGGHCVFNQDILPALQAMSKSEYDSWALMRRLHPAPRTHPTLLVRDGELTSVNDLISEIGIFTVHIAGEPAVAQQGYAGYLVRSKRVTTTEGGVHSGLGVLDSLAVK
ncbi:glutathione synthetase [Vibrio sp. SS-MA-C1-2]|nr:glutathione synthetase [Vibrio sp. SS-MA-C1-2]